MAIAHAAALSESTDEILTSIKTLILNPIIALLFAVALIVFLWGVVQFIRNAESSDGQKKGAEHILYGVIGMAVMLSAYGIINLISNTLRPIQPAQYTPPTSIPIDR